jgi:EAL domain-containing protein (putative c-di-GMP-specific phosphodiesterase class I)
LILGVISIVILVFSVTIIYLCSQISSATERVADYSSLAYLVELPLDVIKIYRAFISYITEYKSSLVLLKAMLQICHDLNKKVVVEGVETQEQVDSLTQYDVDVPQGYFYFKPMPIDEILERALW